MITKSQATSLPSELRAKYIELIRDGSPEAVATAMAIHDDARPDAHDIRDCREALRLVAEAEKPAPRRKLEQVQDKLADVRREIERLKTVESELETEVKQAEPAVQDPGQFRRRAAMIANNYIIRLALADELKAAGV